MEEKKKPRYVSTGKAARRLGVSRSMMASMAKTGRIQAIRVGRLWRIATEAIERIEMGV